MVRFEMIQLQGSVQESIVRITNQVRSVVSKVCLGIDDINVLGSKALVLRAEIYPLELPNLYEALVSIGVKLNKVELPNIESLQDDIEYPLSLQIISLSDDTVRRIKVPQVPG